MGSARAWVAIAAIGGTLGFLPGASAESVDWVQTYSTSGRTGLNDREVILSPSNVGQLQPGWSQSFSGSVRSFLLNDYNILARVTSDDGATVDLYDLRYATGAVRWKINVGRDVDSANSTIATGKKLVFTTCGFVDKYRYDYSGICAYKKSNAKLIWSFTNPCNCSPEARVVSPLVYDRGIIYFGYFNGGSEGKVYAIAARAATGEILGAYQTGGFGSMGNTPMAHGVGQLYFDCGGGVCAVQHRKGTLVWKTSLGAPVGAISADKDRRVYANLCNGTAGLVALDGKTGATIWSYGAPECNGSPAAVAGNRVYFTGADMLVHALDAKTGKELWSAAPGSASSVSVANGVLYVDGGPGAPAASAYDASSGALLWSNEAHGSDFYPPPVIIDGALYVANGACGSLCSYVLPGGTRR